MTTEHPITPPPELVWQWHDEWMDSDESGVFMEKLATQAARWGADQRLEACCEWLEKGPYGFTITASAPHMISDLRAAMRPKPPSLAEEALLAIDTAVADNRISAEIARVTRAALERLQELEKGNG